MNSPFWQKEKKSNAELQKRKIFSAHFASHLQLLGRYQLFLELNLNIIIVPKVVGDYSLIRIAFFAFALTADRSTLSRLIVGGWQPFAERSAAKGWFANASAIPFRSAVSVKKRKTQMKIREKISRTVKSTHKLWNDT